MLTFINDEPSLVFRANGRGDAPETGFCGQPRKLRGAVWLQPTLHGAELQEFRVKAEFQASGAHGKMKMFT